MHVKLVTVVVNVICKKYLFFIFIKSNKFLMLEIFVCLMLISISVISLMTYLMLENIILYPVSSFSFKCLAYSQIPLSPFILGI
jgi:hypothetical protein